MFKTLLISYVDWDSLMEIPQLLNNGGSKVDVFCTANSWAIQNCAYEKWIEGPDEENAFVNSLLNFINTNGNDYDWIIPGDDIIIRLLNERITSEHVFYKIMPLTKIENRALLGSKVGFSTLCNKYNITTPKHLLLNAETTLKSIEEYLGYPFLLKLDRSEGGYGVFLCENSSDFGKHMGNINPVNIVVQQYIRGVDINTEALYKDGKLICYSYSRTLKIIGKFGVSTQRLFYQNSDIEKELQKIGEDFGISGFANIVFMYSETDSKHYLIEVDVRPNAWMNYGRFLGNDFSKGVATIIAGRITQVVPEPKNAGKTITISLFKKDLYRCLLEKDGLGICAWFFNKDGRWRFIPWYDRKLFWACTKYLISSFFVFTKGKIKKTFN